MFHKSYFKGSMKLENFAKELETEGHRLQYRKERYQFGAAMVFLKENFPEPAAMHLLPFAPHSPSYCCDLGRVTSFL